MSDGVVEISGIDNKQDTVPVNQVEFAATGEQTQITPKVKEIADTINGEGVILVMKISDYIKAMDAESGADGPDFSRTAEQVIEDNKYNGCNEAGLVFAALLRAKGISTTYVQALREDAVRNYSKEKPSLNGHVFLEIDLGNADTPKKKIINSITGEITNELPEGMIEGARGLDAWDIGLKEGFQDLEELFQDKQQEIIAGQA